MLSIKVVTEEFYDEMSNKFTTETTTVVLEHSLASLSKWESIHEKPFLSKEEKTKEEILSYVSCMILSPEDSPEIVDHFSQENLAEVNRYIEQKHTATFFQESKSAPSREIVTSELIYYWMIAFQIPFSCESWNLNRLLTLIQVCNIRNKPPKKTSKADLMRRNAEMNAQRRAQFGSSG